MPGSDHALNPRPQRPGAWERLWTACVGVFLGKSSPAYTKKFTGSDGYWEKTIGAQSGWPLHPSPQPDTDE
jgi:hypothetical protein